ncbi:MAG: fumarylacetoacetate hydrolase family protein [Bauldia sp.]|nr:MAG: fumarylacetoacetate hydrolase family protein [Bauldia sp.]MBZ0230435.1 fumarylacetoacetate hydrolase family protein [Bauldia sp.]
MRVATFSVGGERRVGQVDPDARSIAPFDMPAQDAEEGIIAIVRRNGSLPPTLSPIALDRVSLEAPVPLPRRNIFCVGKNYYEHAHEFSRSGFDSSAGAGAVPKHPIIFSKVPESVVPDAARVRIDPRVSTAVDYEAELAVIIGKPGRGIRPEDALDHVWGYTIINDVTARDLQGRYSQWLVAKSQDTFCPMGPWAVSKDEIDISDTAIRCFVNGDIRQSSNTKLLIFDIPTIIATISAGLTLRTGDIIATGTPAGVGIGFDPPRYLKDGDVVRVEIDGIGVLENRVEEVRA